MAGASAEPKAFLELDRCSQDFKANFFTSATIGSHTMFCIFKNLFKKECLNHTLGRYSPSEPKSGEKGLLYAVFIQNAQFYRAECQGNFFIEA
jgi:hypothetical protein